MIVQGEKLEMPSMTLLQMLQQTTEKCPNQPAVWFGEQSLTYQQLYDATLRTMAQLQSHGLSHGQRVGVMLPNCPEYVIAYFAVTGLGAVIVPINPTNTVSELNYLVRDAGVTALIAHESIFDTVAQMDSTLTIDFMVGVHASIDKGSPEADIEGSPTCHMWMDSRLLDTESTAHQMHSALQEASLSPEFLAVLQYTDGVTGWPKGAMLTHANLVANAIQARSLIPGGPAPTDKIVCALPFVSIYALTVCINLSVLTGMSMLIVPQFEPKAVQEVFQQHQPTLFPAVPALYVTLAQIARNVDKTEKLLSSLRVCNSWGDQLPEQVAVHFERLTSAVVLEGYGLSESSGLTHTNLGPHLRKPGSVGLPLPNTEVRVVDVEDGTTDLKPNEPGELLIRGPQVMLGYWQQPDATRRTLVDGWLHTGDIAKIDEDGYAYIVDRMQDFPATKPAGRIALEVEEVLIAHPQLQEAAVVAVGHRSQTQALKAFVVCQATASITGMDIQSWCRQHLSDDKVPAVIEFLDELPKSATGKILRNNLCTDI